MVAASAGAAGASAAGASALGASVAAGASEAPQAARDITMARASRSAMIFFMCYSSIIVNFMCGIIPYHDIRIMCFPRFFNYNIGHYFIYIAVRLNFDILH
jgi:hypothetical protein